MREDVPKGAIYKRTDGIVIIDPEKSKGQKQIVNNCPYGCIFWNEKIYLNWTFCAHLLDQGLIKEPRCVEACPTDALVFGEFDQLKGLIMETKAEILSPEFALKPRIYYSGLPKRFVAGTVLFGEINECAEDVTVTLIEGKNQKIVKTTNYGDFEFEGLEADHKYLVKIEYPGYASQKLSVLTNKDIYLGTIILDKS